MDSNNLLSFVNSASSDIKQAIDKAPKRRRNVTVKKYAENRVKRLDTKKPRSNNPLTTKRQPSSQLKLPSRLPPPSSSSLLQHANTWPAITTTASVQSVGLPTANISVQSSSIMYTGSDSNICLSARVPSRIDPELESLLSELECPSVPISRHGSFDSVCTAPSCTPPLSTLDPVYIAEQQVFSPYSDYSDELDSAYCSPNGSSSAPSSAQVSYCCSPTNLTSSMPDWCPTDLLPPMNANCLQEVGMISSRCNWVSQDTSPLTITTSTTMSSISSPFDQGPPMTPTVSELLQQYNQYP